MERKCKPALIVCAVLTVIGLALEIHNLTQISNMLDMGASAICDILLYVLVCYYATIGYRKPHGNLLKHLMLVFAVCLIPGINYCNLTSRTACGVLFLLAAMSTHHGLHNASASCGGSARPHTAPRQSSDHCQDWTFPKTHTLDHDLLGLLQQVPGAQGSRPCRLAEELTQAPVIKHYPAIQPNFSTF